MLSIKTQNLVKDGSSIRALFVEGTKLKERFGEENVYDFSLGNPSIPTPEEVNIKAIECLKNKNIHSYMNNSGFENVREAIATDINNKENTRFSAKNIIMTVGAAGGINILFNTLLNPNDEVIVFAPYFAEYTNYINQFDCKTVIISPNVEDFQINFDELEEKITSKTKAVLINSPNNPTGVVYSKKTIIKLCSILKNKEREFNNSIYLISDEPYRELLYIKSDLLYIPRHYDNSFVVYSYSKSLSLPGERIGYLVVPNELNEFQNILDGLNVSNRVLGFVNAPSLFQQVIGSCLDVKVNITPYKENLDLLYKSLINIGYECVKPSGAFYLFPKTPFVNDIEFSNLAKKHNLLVVPGSGFACPNHFRISYCTTKDVIERSIKVFEEVYEEAKQYCK
ncbi:MAG: pyridoxal phosphate-dependent aminotransferase [Lachnospirales bacterium]